MIDYKRILFDKSIYEINLLPQTSNFHRFEDETALKKNIESERDFNDGWKGRYYTKYDSEAEKYITEDISQLADIDVTLAPELQGYGKNQYVNSQYPFDGYSDGEFGEDITVDNPCILYAKDFTVGKISPDKRFLLNFKGSESAFFVYLNGEFVGYSENLYLDSVFDITEVLSEGQNRIAVLCFKYSTSTWFLCQDFFRFSGLFRGVTITEKDIAGVEDIDFQSEVDYKNASSHTVITVKGKDAERVFGLELDGKLVWEERSNEKTVSANLSGLKLWSAEAPTTYKLTVRTLKDGKTLDIAVCNIGFRDVKIKDGIILLNGKRIILNGINRHEWDMRRGRSVTAEDMEFDVRFLKEHNVNAVRTSHYPNQNYWYDLCDENGLYLMDEACLESHGSFAAANGYASADSIPGDDMSWLDLCANKVLRMYERDKNHPSILFWSLGNESGTGEVFFSLRKALLNRNPELIIHYEQGYLNEEAMRVSDIYSSMYTPAADVAEFLKTHTDKPYILCEFAHAMGNSLGDLAAYRKLLNRFQNFQGGFIWDYIDQGLFAKNIDGQTALCYGGDFGDRPNDCDFCCNGVIFADRKKSELSSKAQEMKYHYQPVSFEIDESSITVSNNNLFVATDGLKFIFEVVHNGKMIRKDEFSLSIPAGESQKITVANAKPEYGEILYRISAVRNETEVAFEEKVIGRLPEKAASCENAPKVIEGHFNIGVTANGVSYLFTKSGTSYKVAGLVSICVGDEEWLKREPLPTIFRPNTTNDCCNVFRYEAAVALGFSYNVRCDQPSVKWKVENDKFIIRYRYIFDNARNEGSAVEYVIDGSGKMRVNATLEKLSAIPSLPLFGIKFEFPLNKDRFKYFGKGPYDCYPDREKGIQSGIYSSNAAREYVDYIYPQECGNHEDTRWIEIFGENSSLTFKSDKNFSFKFLQYDDISIERATHKEDLPEPRSNYLTVCGFTRGVGGDDSWGAKVHPEFELPATGGYCYSFDIIPKKCKGEK